MTLQIKPRFKLQTFDRNIIRKNWNKMNRTPLQRAGLLVRKIARGSIRRGGKRRKPSKPGRPPRSHKPGTTPPFKMIFTVPGNKRGTQLVGMVGFDEANPVPGLQEHGGVATRRVFVKGAQRRTKKGRFGRRVNKPVRKLVRYPQRAFMLPALLQGKDRMPQLWKNSLRSR